MPLVVTLGFGPQQTSTGGPSLLSVSSTGPTVVLTFSEDVVVEDDAADYTKWKIIPDNPELPDLIIFGMMVVTNTITLTVSEQKDGEVYRVAIPVTRIADIAFEPYTGPFLAPFVGIGFSPFIVHAIQVDARTLNVIFSEPVNPVDATDPAKYSISPFIKVKSATQVTPYQYELRTSKQEPDTAYTVTATGIRDLQGNE